MSHQEIMQRMIVGSGLSWDTVVEPDTNWNDLDLNKIRRFKDNTVAQQAAVDLVHRLGARGYFEFRDLLQRANGS